MIAADQRELIRAAAITPAGGPAAKPDPSDDPVAQAAGFLFACFYLARLPRA